MGIYIFLVMYWRQGFTSKEKWMECLSQAFIEECEIWSGSLRVQGRSCFVEVEENEMYSCELAWNLDCSLKTP